MVGQDASKRFSKISNGLIPETETIRVVIRAIPKGEASRRSAQVNIRAPRPDPSPLVLTGIATNWPNRFARHESVPDSWSADINWFFWVVITDKQLHAFEGRPGKGWKDTSTAGPEAAHFPLNQVDQIAFEKGLVSQVAIWFEDGSSVELEAGIQKLDSFEEVVRPFQSNDPARQITTSWVPREWAMVMGVALLVGGGAAILGALADDGGTVLLIIGIVTVLLGVVAIFRGRRKPT